VEGVEEGLEVIGERLRAARLARRPPLRLADVAGGRLTVGMLSKIERGKVSPSLGTLRYLAGRLGLPLSSLFAEQEAAGAEGGETLGDARAALWLGDPAEAERRAREVAGGTQGRAGGERVRAAALGLVAEAMLERGSAEGAAVELAAASEIAARQEGRPGAGGLLEGHLAWVLGLLERRRGRPAGAERAWTRALELLDGAAGGGDGGRAGAGAGQGAGEGAAARPTALLLRARLLLELGGLHAAAGGQETARNLLGRALVALSRLGDPEAVSRACLSGLPPAGGGSGPGWEETAAGALAASATARRLAEQGQRELARLDRPALRRAAGTPPEVPHSRHLR
jgi:transcriptional regulator with XRE-family HTH domain